MRGGGGRGGRGRIGSYKKRGEEKVGGGNDKGKGRKRRPRCVIEERREKRCIGPCVFKQSCKEEMIVRGNKGQKNPFRYIIGDLSCHRDRARTRSSGGKQVGDAVKKITCFRRQRHRGLWRVARSCARQDKTFSWSAASIYDDSVAPAFCDVFEQAPLTGTPDYLDWLLATIGGTSIDLLVPGIEIDMYHWVDHHPTHPGDRRITLAQ